MKNAMKRTLAGAVVGTTLAVGGAALAALPASAADIWEPGNPVYNLTPGTPGQVDLRLQYAGTATTISALDFTIDAPAALEFQTRTPSGPYGTAGYLRVTEQYTSSPTYIKCDYVSASQLHCGGPMVDTSGNTVVRDVPVNPNDTILFRVTNSMIPVGSSGPANQPINVAGSITTAAGTTTVTSTTVGTVSPATIVDTPVIAPAIAGIALLGAAGTGGGLLASRRKKAKANARAL